MKINWGKCDNRSCNLVAFITLIDTMYDIRLHVCPKHYEELKKQRNWVIEE